ncbi:MAG: adenylate/guanylate cyclase domain-containing protein [Actinomycetes bacterium]
MDRDDASHAEVLDGLHRLVGLPAPRYTRRDVAHITGVDDAESSAWWRAMGFPNAADDEVVFTGADVDLVRRLGEAVSSGAVDSTHVLQLARLLGASFSRVTEAQIDMLDNMLAATNDHAAPSTQGRLEQLLSGDATWEHDVLEDSILYVWRRHLLAALGRAVSTHPTTAEQAVGFVDIVRFTDLAQELDPSELGSLVNDFEARAFDVIASHRGRAVKFIGDEVLFVAPAMDVAAEIALDLLDAEGDRFRCRAGLAFGPTVDLGGDVFGPTVNLASRLTTIARPSTVVLPLNVADQLDDAPGVVVRRINRRYDLKGIGHTRVATVTRAEGAT